MSIRLMTLVWSDHTKTMDTYEKMVLLRMADFAAEDGSSVYPSVNRIVQDTGISRRKVIDIKKALVEKNILQEVRKAVPGKRKSTVYRINVEMLERLQWDSIPLVHTVHQNESSSAPRAPKSSPELVHDMHQNELSSAHDAPELVHTVHQTSAPRAPYPPYNHHNDPPFAEKEKIDASVESSQGGGLKKNSKYSDDACTLVDELRVHLGSEFVHGADWRVSSLAVAQQLLNDGNKMEVIQDVIKWALKEWKYRETVTHMKHIVAAIPLYHRQKTKPKQERSETVYKSHEEKQWDILKQASMLVYHDMDHHMNGDEFKPDELIFHPKINQITVKDRDSGVMEVRKFHDVRLVNDPERSVE